MELFESITDFNTHIQSLTDNYKLVVAYLYRPAFNTAHNMTLTIGTQTLSAITARVFRNEVTSDWSFYILLTRHGSRSKRTGQKPIEMSSGVATFSGKFLKKFTLQVILVLMKVVSSMYPVHRPFV